MFKITKNYHFYAGHRNEKLNDKCFNLHGHTYYVTMTFNLPYDPYSGVTMLFSDIDKLVKPIINELDHGLLINTYDPLCKYLHLFMSEEDTEFKLVKFDNSTSAENLARWIFKRVKELLPIEKITLQETTSSIVDYEEQDTD